MTISQELTLKRLRQRTSLGYVSNTYNRSGGKKLRDWLRGWKSFK